MRNLHSGSAHEATWRHGPRLRVMVEPDFRIVVDRSGRRQEREPGGGAQPILGLADQAGADSLPLVPVGDCQVGQVAAGVKVSCLLRVLQVGEGGVVADHAGT